MANKIKSNWLPILLSLVIVALLAMQGVRASYLPFRTLITSGAGIVMLPAGPGPGTSVTANTTDNTYGSYAEIRGATGDELYIVGISANRTGASAGDMGYVQFQIGTGGAGSETAVSFIRFDGQMSFSSTLSSNPNAAMTPILPWVKVAASTRIAVQAAENGSTQGTYAVTLWVISKANVVPD